MAAYAIDALAWCKANLGKGYFAGGCRCEITCPTQDCSGWIVAALRVAGLRMPCINSAGFAIWGREAGTLVSEQEAIWTPFALGIKGPNGGEDGNGPKGHIVPFVGNGANTYEAMSTARGCTIGSATGRGFVRWMKVPGLTYGPKPPPAPPPSKETDMVVLPGAATPAGRVRCAQVHPTGRYIQMWNGALCKGLDGHRDKDPSNLRRLHPKNGDGTEAWSEANPWVGVGVGPGGKYLVSLRKDGATYLNEVLL